MRRFFIKPLLIFVAVALIAAGSAMPARAASTEEAKHFVDGVAHQALTIIANVKSKDEKRMQLEKLLGSSVDIDWVGRFVLGRFWKQATPEQQQRYMTQYRTFLTKTYTSRFTEYSGGAYKITSTRDDGDGEYTVSMEIHAPDQHDPIDVEYRVRADDKNNFLIFDLIAEGVSMITTQRSEFASVINKNGIDSLIMQIANKTASLTAAAHGPS